MASVVFFDCAPGFFVDGGISCGLIDADVVDFEFLRPDGLVDSLGTAPGAADGDIEQQVEGLVEGPLTIVGLGVCGAFVDEGKEAFAID